MLPHRCARFNVLAAGCAAFPDETTGRRSLWTIRRISVIVALSGAGARFVKTAFDE
jgi:hypothetical protein